MGRRNFSFFLSSIFNYEPILIKISVNANIVKTQIFCQMKYDLKGHLFKNPLFVLFVLLIEEKMPLNIMEYQDDICLVQRRHLSYRKTTLA